MDICRNKQINVEKKKKTQKLPQKASTENSKRKSSLKEAKSLTEVFVF